MVYESHISRSAKKLGLNDPNLVSRLEQMFPESGQPGFSHNHCFLTVTNTFEEGTAFIMERGRILSGRSGLAPRSVAEYLETFEIV